MRHLILVTLFAGSPAFAGDDTSKCPAELAEAMADLEDARADHRDARDWLYNRDWDGIIARSDDHRSDIAAHKRARRDVVVTRRARSKARRVVHELLVEYPDQGCVTANFISTPIQNS